MKIDARIKWLADGYRSKLFEDETLKQAAIKPTVKDNFLLHPDDDPNTFVEYDIGGQMAEMPKRVTHAQRRIKSASAVRLQDRPWLQQNAPKYPAGYIPRSRPSSALPPKTRSPSMTLTPRRIKSAGSVRTLAEARAYETIGELRKGFTLVNKLYENDYRSCNVQLHPASAAPDYRYFDRHSRCYNHVHAHKQPYQDRPQRACEMFLENCGSRAVSPARPDDPNVQPQRYIDYHRPRTAPGTRRELQYIPRPSYVYRNHAPHFCNFVHQISLNNRRASAADLTGVPGSELGDEDEYIMETADGRLISKYRKTSSARAGLTQTPKLEDYECETLHDSIPEAKEYILASGTEGRPGSPSSNDGDSSRLEDENEQQPVFGIEVRVSSPVKLEQSLKSFSLPNDDRKPKVDDVLSSPSGTSISEDSNVMLDMPRDAWETNSKGTEELVVVPSGSDSDNNNRLPSPRQPPPSPEPQKQKKKKIVTDIPLPITQKKRGCVSKKTKKPLEQGRKMKQIEEPKEVVPVIPEQTPATDAPATESEKVEPPNSDVQVPDLPTNVHKTEKEKTEKSKSKKHLIEIDDDLFKPDATDYLNDQMIQSRGDIDWSIMDTNGVEDVKRAPQIKSWIQGRLALSQQSSRFELPMDMKRLEKMTPQEYVRKHCIITSRRQNLYQKIFLKNKEKSQTIIFKDLDRSLKDVLVNTITSEQVQEVLHTLDITESTRVDYRLFAGTAAFAERVLYPQFVTEEYLLKLIELEIVFGLLGTEDTQDMPEYQREKIECADFCALTWKLHGVKVNPQMRKVLEQIS